MSSVVPIDGDMTLAMYMERPGLTIMRFTADWCQSCHKIASDFESLSESYDKITFCQVDIDSIDLDDLHISIEKIPLIIFLKDGDIIDRYIGTDITIIRQKLQNFSHLL